MHFFPERENDRLCHICLQTTTENKKNNHTASDSKVGCYPELSEILVQVATSWPSLSEI